jgi:hypothetical protein
MNLSIHSRSMARWAKPAFGREVDHGPARNDHVAVARRGLGVRLELLRQIVDLTWLDRAQNTHSKCLENRLKVRRIAALF